jgi:hypothetical protein
MHAASPCFPVIVMSSPSLLAMVAPLRHEILLQRHDTTINDENLTERM